MNDPAAPTPAAVRSAALHLLCSLGWRGLDAEACLALRGGAGEVLLKPRLVDYLQTRRFDYKGTSYPLSPGAIDQILRELAAPAAGDGLLAANERFYARLSFGITVTEFMPDGRRHQPTIAIVDWADPAANRFDLTESPQVLASRGAHHRTPDLVGYVNGMPLVVIEAALREGIERHLRHQEDDEIPRLFVYAQLLLAIDGTDGRYGTTCTPARFWARWKHDEESSPAPQDLLLAGLLAPARLLELLRGFVLFDRRVGKIVARAPQFFGVRALLARLSQRRPDGTREGGVVWHTAGSGKSFTMVLLAKALLLDDALKDCRILVVTDRVDLERQLARSFMSGGAFGASIGMKEGERSKAVSGRDLARRIGHGSERITFALVQKFNTASRLPECRNDSPDLIVLADEGHRSHGGETHERMKRALPRAAYVAFTGTPLLKEEKTANRFGPILHAYTLRRAVDDRTVAPLLYEERVPALALDEAAIDRWFDGIARGLPDAQHALLMTRRVSCAAVHGAARRIELIAWDIATHFHQNFKQPATGLKGQLATANQRDAIRYKKALDRTGLVTSAVVISAPRLREGAPESGDDDSQCEVRKWWTQNVSATGSGADAAAHERQALQAFAADGDPDLLIVVDRLLTGFDEPRNAVLYIDKPLQGHSLIQAVARVNRLHDAKHHGLLVDYRGILKQLDAAVRAYQDLEARTLGGFDAADLEGLYRGVDTEYMRLPQLHVAACSFFDAPDRAGFAAALGAFGRCLQTALSSRGFFEDPAFSEAQLARYKHDLRLLREMRGAAGGDASEAQIRQWVDPYVIGTGVREDPARYLVHQLGAEPEEEAAAHWSADRARSEAELIRGRVRCTLEVKPAGDPDAPHALSALLRDAIAEAEAMFEHPHRQYALWRDLERRIGQPGAASGLPEAFSGRPQAAAYFGALLSLLGDAVVAGLDADARAVHVAHALAIDRIVDSALGEHSLSMQDTEAAIRKGLLTLLHASLGLQKTGAVITEVLRIVRAGPGPRGLH